MDAMTQPHIFATHTEWATLKRSLESPNLHAVSLNGRDLSVAEVIAVSLHGTKANLTEDEEVIQRVVDSVDFLDRELEGGSIIYGVNTGFGGNADTRTQAFELLQSAAIQHLNVGILLPANKGRNPVSGRGRNELLRSHALPVPVVRAMMLIRCNSLMRGHSGVRIHVIETILKLLSLDMTPVVPLRGSISASGDLSTLSYIAGAVEGNPDIFVRVGGQAGGPKYLPGNEALDVAGLERIRLQAKEGLGITNGTAASCATACIAIHQTNQLAVLIQLLSAMGTEALAGTAHNYDPFISGVRPHTGQAEAAANIRKFLSGSKISPEKDPDRVGLAQDRYALRTAPQWIGPQLEDLMLATHQVAVELNSTTDNPLIDVEGGRIHHGGNFQAMSITSAMEKAMTALQNLGRLVFAQNSELVNNMANKGLPPNLSPDEPSASFLCKGFDVNMAAYMSELAYLAHPVSTHVQVAEMANQSVNSMALVSARYALEAVEVASLMAATYIFILCQALDLRCMLLEFEKAAAKDISLVIERVFSPPKQELDRLSAKATQTLLQRWTQLSHLDNVDRGKSAVQESLGAFLIHISHLSPDFSTLQAYQTQASDALSTAYGRTRREFFEQQTTTQLISPASKIVYNFVRKELAIPLIRGVVDHPTLMLDRKLRGAVNDVNGEPGGSLRGKVLGTMASEIYLALRNGELHSRVMKFCDDTKFWT